MRVSTLTLYAQSMRGMQSQQSSLLELSQQIASGKRVVRPSDDPQAASRAVQVGQAQAITSQYTESRVSARNALAQEESVLNSVTEAIASAKTLVLEAANGTLSDADRASVASQLRGIYETVVGQANATDGNGRYLFGGHDNRSEPFVTDASGQVQYVGSDAMRQVRVDASRLMDVGDTGRNVFLTVRGTSGFKAVADTANTGSVTFDGPHVVDATAANFGDPFAIEFSVGAGGATYSVNGGAAQPYAPGQVIEHGGLAVTLDGAPANGDRIQVDRADNMNSNLFRTFEKALAVLEEPIDNAREQAAFDNVLGNVMSELDNSLDNVLMVRASVGSRLNELKVIDDVAGNRQLNYAQTKSNLVDLDYNVAISEYGLRQVGLQAAQKAFVTMTNLSLFKML